MRANPTTQPSQQFSDSSVATGTGAAALEWTVATSLGGTNLA